jgi:hypothetical protein
MVVQLVRVVLGGAGCLRRATCEKSAGDSSEVDSAERQRMSLTLSAGALRR